jgi:hypothetical protein
VHHSSGISHQGSSIHGCQNRQFTTILDGVMTHTMINGRPANQEEQVRVLAVERNIVIFGGRLAEYKY